MTALIDKVEIFIKDGKPEEKFFYDGYYEVVQYYLKKLTDEQRMELFREYCTSCGSDNPKCQCWNDE